MEYFGLDDIWQFDLDQGPTASSPKCPSLETSETSSSFDDYNLSDEQVLQLVGLEMEQPMLMDLGFDKDWDLQGPVVDADGLNLGVGPGTPPPGAPNPGAPGAATACAATAGGATMQLPMQTPSMQHMHSMQPVMQPHAQVGHSGHPGLMGHAPHAPMALHHPRPPYSRPAPDWSPHRRSISKMPLAQLYHIMGLPHDHNRARDREERIMRMLSESGFEIGQKTWIRDTEESFRRKVIEKIFMATKDEYGYSKALLEAIVRRGTYARMQSNLRRRRRHMIRASRRR